jgi:hypothetical protein
MYSSMTRQTKGISFIVTTPEGPRSVPALTHTPLQCDAVVLPIIHALVGGWVYFLRPKACLNLFMGVAS